MGYYPWDDNDNNNDNNNNNNNNNITIIIIMENIQELQVIHHKTQQPDYVATINYRNFGKIRNPSKLRVT